MMMTMIKMIEMNNDNHKLMVVTVMMPKWQWWCQKCGAEALMIIMTSWVKFETIVHRWVTSGDEMADLVAQTGAWSSWTKENPTGWSAISSSWFSSINHDRHVSPMWAKLAKTWFYFWNICVPILLKDIKYDIPVCQLKIPVPERPVFYLERTSS